MIAVLNLGRCEYAIALRLQEGLVELRQQGRIPNVLLFVEHPSVITLGRNARPANINASRDFLETKGVAVHEINRGGDVTFHGPGQLVAYPIFDLRSFSPRLGAVSYVRLLEDVLMRICAYYRIETQRIAGLTGVWTYPTTPPRLSSRPAQHDYLPAEDISDHEPTQGGPPLPNGGPDLPAVGKSGEHGCWPERKIAAIGVHIARGVTSHGFALNVTTNLDFFRLIVPCGLSRPVTSIEFETGRQPSLDEVATCASRCFGERLGAQMLWLESIHDLLPERATPATGSSPGPPPAAQPCDTAARAPENERHLAGDDFHRA